MKGTVWNSLSGEYVKMVRRSCGEKVGDEKDEGGEWQSEEERGGLAFSQSGGSAAFQPPQWPRLMEMGAWTK